MPTKLGYSALIDKFELQVPPLRQTFVMGERSTNTIVQAADGTERVKLRKRVVQPDASAADHLTFALKREEPNLAVLAALFERQEALAEVRAWLAATPSSSYARKAGYLAEWLTGVELEFRAPPGVRREALLDEQRYVTGPARSVPKWGLVNNLLGTREFSPLVRRTPALESLLAEKLEGKVHQVVDSLEPEILQRAVDYLYLSETRSTYSIEREIPDNNRAARFRHLLESAGEPGALSEEQFANWQNRIVNNYSAEAAYRQGQNWLSRSGRLRNIADFIPPPAAMVPPMMEGINELAQMTASHRLDPVVGAACAAFGFVFVHPFYDGNGRLHRFLIHHLLRQSGFTPKGVVLPISARMLSRIERYSELLKAYSRPRTELLNYRLDADSGTIHVTSPQPHWLYAYFDATELCEFLLECVKETVEVDLVNEVRYLRSHDAAVRELEDWLDLPQSRLNTLIDVIVQNHGALAKGKRKLVEMLNDEQIARIEEVVSRHFAEHIKAQA